MRISARRGPLGLRPARSWRAGMVLAYVVVMIPIFLLGLLVFERAVIQETRFVMLDVARSQAFYLAEAGLNVAFDAFAASNYSATTHGTDGSTATTGNNQLQVSVPGVSRDAAGWYTFTNTSSMSFSGTGAAETFRFQVYFPSTSAWKIVCEAGYGRVTTGHAMHGTTQTAFGFALYGASNLSEFVRGANQTINGSVHCNGPMYFRPTGTTLTVKADSITSSGYMIRYQDAWGRADTSGTVQISNGSASGSLVTMNGASQGASGQGNAYDSYHADWRNTGSSGALQKWGGVVQDGTLGAAYVAPPSVQTLQAGGYYDSNAGLRITSSTSTTWATPRTFYNHQEGRSVTVIEVDVSRLNTTAWPSNGLIYASTPIRLVNAQKLNGPLTIASACAVYTKGNFNMIYPTASDYSSGTSRKQPASIVTGDRIYHLSDAFNDANNVQSSGQPTGSHTPLYSGDPSNTLEINGALVDGQPTVTERNYAGTATTNSAYWTGTDTNKAGQTCWANTDNFLETLGSGFTVKKAGSIVHLQSATMARYDNSNASTTVMPWIVRTWYAAPTRNYSYDGTLGSATTQPPFFPALAQKTFWQITHF